MTAPNATPQQATVAIAVESSAVARSGTAVWMRAGASSGSGQATARPTAENTLAATKSAGKPPSRTSCSPSVGASACVARVETPKRPRAAARRPSGANSAASVEAALKPAAKASPCSARSAKIAGPMRSTRRKAPAAADMVAIPPSRKMRRPKRSRSAPTASTLTRPARPLVPITTPIVRSVPPSARTCNGRRKNDAKVRKKQKFAAVTRAKQAVRVEGGMGPIGASRLAAASRALYRPRMATERRRELRRRRKRRRERLKERRHQQAKERRRQPRAKT
jgi:hypothetical protein